MIKQESIAWILVILFALAFVGTAAGPKQLSGTNTSVFYITPMQDDNITHLENPIGAKHLHESNQTEENRIFIESEAADKVLQDFLK